MLNTEARFTCKNKQQFAIMERNMGENKDALGRRKKKITRCKEEGFSINFIRGSQSETSLASTLRQMNDPFVYGGEPEKFLLEIL